MADRILRIAQGEARTWTVRFLDQNRDPLDLTGWTLALADAGSEIDGSLDIEWSDASAGEASLTLDSLPDLSTGAGHSFRITRTSPGGSLTSSPPMRIVAR